jgi:hypothetical protein
LTPRVNPRARGREDRAGDPLDGLVNLFDLGIVLAVAFLLAALTSIDLAPSVLQQNQQQTGGAQVPADSVIVEPGEETNPIELQPGEEVVGQGEPVGTVYRLSDGRTVIVRPEDEEPVPGEAAPEGDTGGGGSDGGSGSSGSTTPSPETTPSPDGGAGAPDDALDAPQPSTGAP